MEQSIPLFLSRNDSIGSVVLAASSSARASLFTRYGPSIGPRLALASSCERIRDAITFLPTESFRRGPVSWGMPASWGGPWAWLPQRSIFQRGGWHFGKHPSIVTR